MKTQQAPPPVQSAFFVPRKLACATAHSTKGTSVTQKRASMSSVTTTLPGLPSRLARTQPSAAAIGRAPRAGRVSLSATIASALLQGDGAVVPVHEGRGDEVHREEDEHDDGHGLDRLAGLVQGGAADHEEDLGIGDGGAERAALDDVEVLAGERRD